ncbi:MAG: glycosyltransferase, partial [Deltaproteobacteria bacterium]|nr:glycosyltransferase [Candidatus Tharpella sp.]
MDRFQNLISIIIPTLNEELSLAAAVDLARLGEGVEIVVADGGSSDHTVKIARALGVQVVLSQAGRARQMNAGARAPQGAMLL